MDDAGLDNDRLGFDEDNDVGIWSSVRDLFCPLDFLRSSRLISLQRSYHNQPLNPVNLFRTACVLLLSIHSTRPILALISLPEALLNQSCCIFRLWNKHGARSARLRRRRQSRVEVSWLFPTLATLAVFARFSARRLRKSELGWEA